MIYVKQLPTTIPSAGLLAAEFFTTSCWARKNSVCLSIECCTTFVINSMNTFCIWGIRKMLSCLFVVLHPKTTFPFDIRDDKISYVVIDLIIVRSRPYSSNSLREQASESRRQWRSFFVRCSSLTLISKPGARNLRRNFFQDPLLINFQS